MLPCIEHHTILDWWCSARDVHFQDVWQILRWRQQWKLRPQNGRTSLWLVILVCVCVSWFLLPKNSPNNQGQNLSRIVNTPHVRQLEFSRLAPRYKAIAWWKNSSHVAISKHSHFAAPPRSSRICKRPWHSSAGGPSKAMTCYQVRLKVDASRLSGPPVCNKDSMAMPVDDCGTSPQQSLNSLVV